TGDLAFGHAEEYHESAPLGRRVATNIGPQGLLYLRGRQPSREGDGQSTNHLGRSDITPAGTENEAAVSRPRRLHPADGTADAKTSAQGAVAGGEPAPEAVHAPASASQPSPADGDAECTVDERRVIDPGVEGVLQKHAEQSHERPLVA